jgi:DNA-binding SARP family transcriptional activator
MRLLMLGSFQVEGGAAVDPGELLAQPKALALLTYVLLARPRGFHQRDRLVGLFWPEFDQEHARGALRKLLHRLRQTIGDDMIEGRGNELVGVAPSSVWCDAIAFEQAIAEDRLREALDLYQGDLLPGFFLPGAADFERWLEAERAYYKDRAVNAAWELVERYVADSQLTNAGQLARIVARLSPTDERMLRRVMSMLARLGDRAGAVDVYVRFAEQLWKELDIRPSRETTQLAESIKIGNP